MAWSVCIIHIIRLGLSTSSKSGYSTLTFSDVPTDQSVPQSTDMARPFLTLSVSSEGEARGVRIRVPRDHDG